MGVINRNVDTPGNFVDCMKRRIRHHSHPSMPTRTKSKISPAECESQISASQWSYLNRKRGNDFQGWATCTDGRSRLDDGETSGWGALARSSLWKRCHVCPIITAETHANAKVHSNNTAAMSAVVEALSFLDDFNPARTYS